MCNKVSEEDWANPNKIFLEPCQGNGQFTIFILYRRIHEYNIPWRKALETMYTCELMEDNVQESRQRVHELLRNIAPDYSPSEADTIMDKNFVCSDFFKWDFKNWCPKKEEPKKIQKDLFEKFKFPKPKKTKQVKIDKPKKKKIIKDNSKQLEIEF